MNETIKLLTNRSSIRGYKQVPVQVQHQDAIEEAIYRAPTAGNMQDFSVIKVTDEDLKTRLSSLCDNQLFIKQAPLIYIFVSDFTRYKRYFELNKVDDGQFVLPHLGTMMNGIIDATIAAQTASVAANSLGLGTCYIGDVIENYEDVTKLLNLNSNMIPVAMLTMGYFEQEIKLSPKIDRRFIFHENHYIAPTDNDIKEIFSTKQIPKKYRDQYSEYSQFYYDHKVGADFSREMDRSLKLYLDNFLNNHK